MNIGNYWQGNEYWETWWFCLLKEKIEEIVQQSKRLDSKSRRLDHLIKFLNDS